ncbi:MAG: Glu-tRNA(Gln) amidotransferase subunit GatE [Candidatus Njordarchaeota archaeon]
MIDYKEVGLKVGLEIHQQLKSPRKLFCYCEPKLIDKEPDITVVRFLRPTLSETGEIDPTIEKEFKKGRKIIYQMYRELCLYEIDEKPPENVDKYSLITALLLAKIFHMDVPDILFVSRKQYLDGSVPSGFQRTILVGLNGWLELPNGKKVGISQICLEEDAARKIKETANEIIFRVDRLGIPLVEITTDANLETPEEVLECALRIGAILRATRRVRRGLGTIRQDINISIRGGSRVEIKGVQYPEWFKPLIDNEIKRQQKLIEIAKRLKERGVTEQDIKKEKPIDATSFFKNTKANFIKKAIKRGEKAYVMKLPGFGGILGEEILPGKRLGKEFAERVKVIVGLAGIIHTDELPAYGISLEEKNEMFKITNGDPKRDCVVLIIGPKQKVLDAFGEVIERAILALSGPPEETRRANPDGTTSFERPIGGAGRLYPDTDSPPIYVSPDLRKTVETIEYHYPWEIAKNISRKYNIPEKQAYKIVLSPKFDLFEAAVDSGINPKLIIRAFELMTSLRREGYNTDTISDDKIIEILSLVRDNKISKEAIEDILRVLANYPKKSVKAAIEELKIQTVSEADVRSYVINLLQQKMPLIKERKERSFKPLMGLVMKEFRGKIDGKIIASILKEELEKILQKISNQ